jgi:hypothetical protein
MTTAAAAKLKGWSLVFRGLAFLLLISMLVAAWHDASQAWDVNYYHLPFAGRLLGLLPATSYVFSDANLARYQGFGLLAEVAQGIFWRVTGRPESVNLVAFASVPLLAWFAAKRLGVPWALTVLSLLAIPLVHTHATSAYVDLPGNAAASVLVLITLEAYASERPVAARTALLAFLAAGVAANVKPMLEPIALVTLLFLGVRWARLRAPGQLRGWAVGALLLPLVFATPLKNLIVYGNPVFPVRLALLGHAMPGTEEAYSSSPVWLEHAPRTARFFCSLFEVGLRPFSDPRRWTLDQWMPPAASGYRMGGFFHAYVLAHIGVLAWRFLFRRTRAVRVAVAGFTLLTVVVSLMPQSHELRYYMVWMIVLVLINLWLASQAAEAERSTAQAWLGGVATLALATVLLVTRGAYAYPSGSSFDELVHAKVDPRVVESIGPSERVCVNQEPFDVLWAPTFHRQRGQRDYVLKEAETLADCEGFRVLEAH